MSQVSKGSSVTLLGIPGRGQAFVSHARANAFLSYFAGNSEFILKHSLCLLDLLASDPHQVKVAVSEWFWPWGKEYWFRLEDLMRSRNKVKKKGENDRVFDTHIQRFVRILDLWNHLLMMECEPRNLSGLQEKKWKRLCRLQETAYIELEQLQNSIRELLEETRTTSTAPFTSPPKRRD